MTLLLQSVLSGVLLGGVYALLGIGLTLVLGVVRIVNLAHGELALLGMLATWGLHKELGWDPTLSIVVVAPLLFLLGALLQTAVVERALSAPPQHQALLTIGLGLAMSGAVALEVAPGRPLLAPSSASPRLGFWGLSVPEPLLLSFGVAVAIAAALALFLLRTDAGRALRATAQDREAAQLMGVNVRRMSWLAFGLGAALAGTAGALVAPTGPVSPQAGGAFTLSACAIAVLGGPGSLAGAAAGGVAVGVIQALAGAYLASGLEEAVVPVLLLVLLLVNPSFLPGKAHA